MKMKFKLFDSHFFDSQGGGKQHFNQLRGQYHSNYSCIFE